MEVGADGLIGRKVMGKGTALFCQVDPDSFHADEKKRTNALGDCHLGFCLPICGWRASGERNYAVMATGRGITGDIATYSHPDDAPSAKAKGRRSRDGKTVVPSSLDPAFVLDGPGEYEVSGVLLTGVRTYRDDDKGSKRGKGTAFVVELDGLHTIHLGDIGHLLSEEKLGDIGPALDGLVAKGCDFWVLELHTQETLEQTRRIVDEYLAVH